MRSKSPINYFLFNFYNPRRLGFGLQLGLRKLGPWKESEIPLRNILGAGLLV